MWFVYKNTELNSYFCGGGDYMEYAGNSWKNRFIV